MKLYTIIRLIVILILSAGLTIALFPGPTKRIVIDSFFVYISLLLIILTYKQFSKIELNFKVLLYALLIYGIIIMLYSCYVANTYVQWRYLFTVFVPTLLLPFIAIYSSNLNLNLLTIKTLKIFAIPLSFILYFSTISGMNDFTHYISFIYLFVLMIPFINFNWKCIIIFLSVASFFYDLESRSNLFNFSLVLIILIMGYLARIIKIDIIFKTLFFVFIFSPIVLLILGVSGYFNIFQNFESREKITIKTQTGKEEVLNVDSRTFIYVDAINEIRKQDAFIFGLSAAGYHKTLLAKYYRNYENGRMGSESGILEYFLRGGLIYVFIVFLLFFNASRLAIFNSNNIFIKMLGIYVASRWLFLFIESPVWMNLSNLSTFVAVGMCLSPKIRTMNEKNISLAIRSAF